MLDVRALFDWAEERDDAFWSAMEASERPSSWVARAMRHKLGADTEQVFQFRAIGGMGPDGERERLFRPEDVR